MLTVREEIKTKQKSFKDHDKKNIEGSAKEGWKRHRKKRSDPAQFIEQNKSGYHHDLTWKHHGQNHAGEPKIPPGKPEPRKAKRHDGRGQGAAKTMQKGYDQRIFEENAKTQPRKAFPSIHVVFKGQRTRNQA